MKLYYIGHNELQFYGDVFFVVKICIFFLNFIQGKSHVGSVPCLLLDMEYIYIYIDMASLDIT